MLPKRGVSVGVAIGVTVLGVFWGVRAADKAAIPAGQSVRGTLVAKAATAVDVRAEDAKEIRRYLLVPPGFKAGPKVQTFVRDLAIGSEVEIAWRPDGNARIVTRLAVLAPPGKFGLLAGRVSARGDIWLEIKDEQGAVRRFIPRWHSGGLDKEMLAAVVSRCVGDEVRIRWCQDDHVRVTTMRVLALAPDSKVDNGTIAGAVSEKGRDWISIRLPDGSKEKLLVQRIVGAKGELDKDVLKAIAAARIGEPARAQWLRDGEKRLYSLKTGAASTSARSRPAASAPATAPTTSATSPAPSRQSTAPARTG